MLYKKSLREPWFTLIKLGIKKYEGRLYVDIWKDIKIGDTIIFTNKDIGERVITVKIKSIQIFKSLIDMFNTIDIIYILPGFNNIDDGYNLYHKYYTKDDEKKYGMVLYEIEIIE